MRALSITLIALGATALAATVPSFSETALASHAPTSPVPKTMLAAAFESGGGPEVLSLHTLPVPTVRDGEILIAVHTAGVGAWEMATRRQSKDYPKDPKVLGLDGSGTVAAVGSNVHGFKIGDEVYASGGRTGFYAEYAAVPVEHVAHVPKSVGMTEAGILATSGLAALQGIDDVLRLKRGDTLIIHGAAGGVGTLAVQFATLRGVRVLATATSDESLALVRELGANVVVNGKTGDIQEAIRRFAPEGADAVLALAGGDALERCIDGLRRDGRGKVAYLYGMEPLPRPRYEIQMILYSDIAGIREFAELNRAVERAKLKVPIAAEFRLADAADAHRRFEKGGVLGKIAIRVR